MTKIKTILESFLIGSVNEAQEIESIDSTNVVGLKKALKECLVSIGRSYTSDGVVQDSIILVLSKPNVDLEIPLEFDMFSNNGKILKIAPDYFQRLAERNGFKTFSIKINNNTPPEA